MACSGIERSLYRRGYRRVAGVDEAGRGPLAGPVVIGAVILPPGWRPPVPLDDSKRLSAAGREAAYRAVRAGALAWRLVVVPPAEIDRLNILQATLAGMARAVARLRPAADYVLVDGDRLPPLEGPAEARVGGDGEAACIAAASVLAKVVRDRLMAVYGRRYPEWGFARHKGYGTPAHREALARHGPSPIHRRSFRTGGAAWSDETGSAGTARQLPLGIWSDEAT